MAILIPLQHSSYAYPSNAAAAAAASDVFFPVSVHRPKVSRSSPRYCQLSDHQTPPLSPLPRSRIARTDKSLLNVSESFSEAELWAAANLRVRIFYQFNEQTFGIEDHKKYLADLEFQALKERVAGKKMGFRKVSCINATLPISLVSNISHDLCTSCKFSHNKEDRVVVGTLDLNQCVSLPHEIVGMKPKTIGADFARAYLSNVCVADEFQRNGFGYELMAKAKNVAEAWGISDLYVHVAVDNEAAKHLYMKSGFSFECDEPAWQARFLDRPRRLLLWTALPITYELKVCHSTISPNLRQLATGPIQREKAVENMRRRKYQAIQAPIDEDISKKLVPNQYSSSLNKIFTLCLVLRIINSLLVQTYFNPDEHWQSLEVAHRIAFGYGHLTWEWRKGLRSYLHPLLFAVLYKILAFLRLDSPWFMTRTPRLLQSIFAAFGDLYLYKLSKILFGDCVANWALFAQLTNWFMFFCITRTLSNCLESVLTLVSLYYWPCIRVSPNAISSSSRKFALAMAALACAIRPTSAIIWIYIGTLELLLARDKLKFVLLDVVPIGGLVLGLTTLLDRLMYGSWVIVPLNFVKFNFLSSGGDYYGTHPWHWYFSQGFTVMVFTYLPFSLAGFIMSKQWKLCGLVAWVLGTYSLLGHKEFRFVLPVLPLALMFSGYSLAKLSLSELSKRKLKESSSSYVKRLTKLQMAVFFLLLTNIPMALYMSMVHQRGTEDVMRYLSKEASENKVKNILFLTPCHATPYYSTLHHDLPMRFLDCTPSEEKGILDESDQFLLHPFGFATELVRNWSLPSHIVMFDAQEKLLKEILSSRGFCEVRRFFHAHFKVDRELQSSVVVHALQGY